MVGTVLISDVTSYKACVVARHIANNYPGIRIISCDSRRFSSTLRTSHAQEHFVLKNPIRNEESYAREVAQLINSRAVDLYFPVNSAEMDIVLRRRELFGACLNYWGSYEAFCTLNDKNRLHKLASSLGIRVPRAFGTPEQAQYPLVVKLTRSSAAKGVFYANNRAQLDVVLAALPSGAPYVLQEYVGGEGVGYSLFARNGEILAAYGHKRLLEYPFTGGSSLYRTGYEHPDMAPVAAALMGATCWSGLAMLEFKLDALGQLWLIEINPRIWGSIHQGLANGVNYFAPLLGPGLEGLPARPVNTYLSPFTLAALLRYAGCGNVRPLKAFAKDFRRSRPDVGLCADFTGFLGLLARMACNG